MIYDRISNWDYIFALSASELASPAGGTVCYVILYI